MCLILFSLGHHPRFPVIIAANRDERYHRPTSPLAFWSEAPHIAAGRDLDAGGTWLGITRDGRWAALTNYRQAKAPKLPAPSRGRLVSNYLEGDLSPEDYVHLIGRDAGDYNGFNLLVGVGASACYLSNRGGPARSVAPGVHGLSNHLLDTPWPKVVVGTRALQSLPNAAAEVITESLLATLANRIIPPDAVLPDTGVGIEHERTLSPPFIAAESYGTRASTVLLVDDRGNVSIVEYLYGSHGVPSGSGTLVFSLTGSNLAKSTATLNQAPDQRRTSG
jgi:uncharacterized protein with NRDE domain